MPAAESSKGRAEVARETAARFERAVADGEIDDFLALLAPDVDYEAPSVMQRTTMKLHGREEVRRYLERIEREYEELRVEPKKIRDLGDSRFLIVGWWQARPHQTASPIGTPVAFLLDIGDGTVHRVRAFFDEQQAIGAGSTGLTPNRPATVS